MKAYFLGNRRLNTLQGLTRYGAQSGMFAEMYSGWRELIEFIGTLAPAHARALVKLTTDAKHTAEKGAPSEAATSDIESAFIERAISVCAEEKLSSASLHIDKLRRASPVITARLNSHKRSLTHAQRESIYERAAALCALFGMDELDINGLAQRLMQEARGSGNADFSLSPLGASGDIELDDAREYYDIRLSQLNLSAPISIITRRVINTSGTEITLRLHHSQENKDDIEYIFLPPGGFLYVNIANDHYIVKVLPIITGCDRFCAFRRIRENSFRCSSPTPLEVPIEASTCAALNDATALVIDQGTVLLSGRLSDAVNRLSAYTDVVDIAAAGSAYTALRSDGSTVSNIDTLNARANIVAVYASGYDDMLCLISSDTNVISAPDANPAALKRATHQYRASNMFSVSASAPAHAHAAQAFARTKVWALTRDGNLFKHNVVSAHERVQPYTEISVEKGELHRV